MSAEMEMPATMSARRSNQDHLFSLLTPAQRCCGREYLRLHGRGKSTYDVVSIMRTGGKPGTTYWLPPISVNVDPVIVVSLAFESIPVDFNGEGSVSACRFI